MAQYTYPISAFVNGLDVDAFIFEIRASSIVVALDYVDTNTTDVDVYFKDTLSVPDEATLTALVTSHSGEPLAGTSTVIVNINEVSSTIIRGTRDWDRSFGGVLLPPRGTAFPASPTDGELFFREDTDTLYIKRTAGWVAVSSTGLGTSDTLVFSCGGIGTSTTSRYIPFGNTPNNAPTQPISFRIARAGTLRNLRIRHNTAGVGGNITYTILVNGVASALSLTMAASSTDATELITTVSVTSGDLIDVRASKASSLTSSPNEVTVSIEFED